MSDRFRRPAGTGSAATDHPEHETGSGRRGNRPDHGGHTLQILVFERRSPAGARPGLHVRKRPDRGGDGPPDRGCATGLVVRQRNHRDRPEKGSGQKSGADRHDQRHRARRRRKAPGRRHGAGKGPKQRHDDQRAGTVPAARAAGFGAGRVVPGPRNPGTGGPQPGQVRYSTRTRLGGRRRGDRPHGLPDHRQGEDDRIGHLAQRQGPRGELQSQRHGQPRRPHRRSGDLQGQHDHPRTEQPARFDLAAAGDRRTSRGEQTRRPQPL